MTSEKKPREFWIKAGSGDMFYYLTEADRTGAFLVREVIEPDDRNLLKRISETTLPNISRAELEKSLMLAYDVSNQDAEYIEKLREALDVARDALSVGASRKECRHYECCASCGPIYECEEALTRIQSILGEEERK